MKQKNERARKTNDDSWNYNRIDQDNDMHAEKKAKSQRPSKEKGRRKSRMLRRGASFSAPLIRVENSSNIGALFIKYYVSRNEDPYEHIPRIEVCVKVLSISDVNVVDHSFCSEIILMIDWIDYSIAPLLDADNDEGKEIKWEDHFVPNITIDNCIESKSASNSKPRVKSVKECRVTMTKRVMSVLRNRYDLRSYPFDNQTLEIKFKSRGVPNITGKSSTVVLDSPRTWRKHKGHSLGKNVDWLSEWDIVSLDGAPDGKCQDEYRVQINIARESLNAMSNLVLSLAVIVILSFTSYAIPIDDLADRLQVQVTLLLTTMTFKFILSDTLPSVPYLTTMDRYVISGLLTLAVQGIGFCVSFVLDEEETFLFHNFHVRDVSFKIDMIFLAVIFAYQAYVHVGVLIAFRRSQDYAHLERGPRNCVIKKVSNEQSVHPLARDLVNTNSDVHTTYEIYRPYRNNDATAVWMRS